MADDTFDFGFTAVDEPSDNVQQPQPALNNDEVLDKLAQLEAKIIQADNSNMVNEHRALIESDVAGKLRDVEDLVLPLLYNFCLLYTSPSPRDATLSRMPSSA